MESETSDLSKIKNTIPKADWREKALATLSERDKKAIGSIRTILQSAQARAWVYPGAGYDKSLSILAPDDSDLFFVDMRYGDSLPYEERVRNDFRQSFASAGANVVVSQHLVDNVQQEMITIDDKTRIHMIPGLGGNAVPVEVIDAIYTNSDSVDPGIEPLNHLRVGGLFVYFNQGDDPQSPSLFDTFGEGGISVPTLGFEEIAVETLENWKGQKGRCYVYRKQRELSSQEAISIQIKSFVQDIKFLTHTYLDLVQLSTDNSARLEEVRELMEQSLTSFRDFGQANPTQDVEDARNRITRFFRTRGSTALDEIYKKVMEKTKET